MNRPEPDGAMKRGSTHNPPSRGVTVTQLIPGRILSEKRPLLSIDMRFVVSMY